MNPFGTAVSPDLGANKVETEWFVQKNGTDSSPKRDKETDRSETFAS